MKATCTLFKLVDIFHKCSAQFLIDLFYIIYYFLFPKFLCNNKGATKRTYYTITFNFLSLFTIFMYNYTPELVFIAHIYGKKR